MIKGTLRTVVGDATEPQKQVENEIVVIAHLCNNENKWGAGFVLALNKKWKEPEQRYRAFCEGNNPYPKLTIPVLGKTCYAKIDEHLVIANMIGQDGVVSADNLKPIKYKALANCMAEVVEYIDMIRAQTSSPVVIHCPKFGSLRAGGNFDFVLELINEIWIDNGIDVVVYEFEE